MDTYKELFEISKKLEQACKRGDSAATAQPIQALHDAASKLKSSFSGSWLGYHSRVYYKDLRPAPAGANFSQEWGLKDLSPTSLGSVGDWREYQFDAVIEHIMKQAGNPALSGAYAEQQKVDKDFDGLKSEMLSILETELSGQADQFLVNLKDELEQLEPLPKNEVIHRWSPKGQIATRDMIAAGQGNTAPPHIEILASVTSIRHSFEICQSAADIAKKAASHLERKGRKKAVAERVGTNVFIGHGRSLQWRTLKDFIKDRMGLPYDEFNRVPVAGVTNTGRLSEMLDAAAIAFVVMTAEDEMVDGATQARMNVVHEAGLFQGRLGFTRAILLLEEGCAEFSNIQGLGQIRFPKGNIGAAFEEIRLVLEREGLTKAT